MEDEEVRQAITRLAKCERRKAEWGREAKALRTALIDAMSERGIDELQAGRLRFRRDVYTREQLDVAMLRNEAPGLYKALCVPREVCTYTLVNV